MAAALASLVVPTVLPAIPIMMGALLAYDGLNRRSMAYATALLIGIELIGGLDLGVFSFAFLLTALLFAAAGRVCALSPWAGTEGWHIIDMVRTAVVAALLAALMVVGSVCVAAFGYGFGMPLERLSLAFSSSGGVALILGAVMTVGILRRIDVPFRRSIRFGM